MLARVSSLRVDTAALRSAAGQVSAVGTEVTTAAGTIAAQVQAGTVANPGFATSDALDGFASQLSSSMGTLGQGLDGHAERLIQCATGYDEGEADTAALFQA